MRVCLAELILNRYGQIYASTKKCKDKFFWGGNRAEMSVKSAIRYDMI